MNGTVKVALIGGGVAFLFWDKISALFGSSTTTTTTASQTPTVTTPTVNTTVSAPPVQVVTQPVATPTYVPVAPWTATPVTPVPVTSPLATLPITSDTLIKASYDPNTAALLGNSPAGMLNVDQWNYYRNQSGKPQITVDLFSGDRSQLITATDYLSRVAYAQSTGMITSLQGLPRRTAGSTRRGR